MKSLRVLAACEESQAVCKAFRELGHEAYSCDIEPCSGGHPEWHFQCDIHEVLKPEMNWDLLIAFPPCTYLTNASAVRMRVKGVIQQQRYEKMWQARAFFLEFYTCNFVPFIAVENPVPMKICDLPKYDQIIQPYEHGHPYSKRTCLWLRNLPKLVPTKMMDHWEPYVNGGNLDAHGNYRQFKGRNERDAKTRAKTFPGIAKAMAEQWGKYVSIFTK